MIKKTIATLLFSMSSILFISINCFGGLPGPPSVPDKCVKCHGFDIYDEWIESKHGDGWIEGDTNTDTIAKAICFDCHIPGGAQKVENYTLKPGEKKGFHVLGYYDDVYGWMRLSPRQVCLRCHGQIVNDKYLRECTLNLSKFYNICHECHMPVDGLKTYRVHEDKPISLEGFDNNIAKYVTREHRDHKFPKKPDIPDIE